MAKAEATVEELVSMIERGELRLPEMQRQYVWRAPRVRDLLDSLYRGYPSGAILLWETDKAPPERTFAVEQTVNPYRATRLLLDGQQRLTSLSAVIRGTPVKVKGRKRPIELLFNLEHPDDLEIVTEVNEESNVDETADEDTDSTEDELEQRFQKFTFIVATKKLARRPNWISVSEVFQTDEDAPLLAKAGVERLDDPRYTKYSKRLARLRAIRKYIYRMDVLQRDLSYEEVTEIFVRVNSLGAKLRSSDLALAQITAKWRTSLAVFQEFQQQCAEEGFDLDLGVHLKALVVFATGQSRFRLVAGISADRLQEAWDRTKPGVQFAMNFLKANTGIDTPALLASPFLIVALASYGDARGYDLSPEEADGLRTWALLANTKGRYSRGSSETILDQDLRLIRDGKTPEDLVEQLRQQVGRLDITPAELEGRNQRSAVFKTMFLAFRAAGAKDWRSNLIIATSHSGNQHRLQFHHIFPKAVLRKQFRPREADDIANLAFIAGKTNLSISAKEPAKYVSAIIAKNGDMCFRAQAIPTAPELLEVEAYPEFLVERRRLVAERLNGFLGQAPR